MPKKKLLSQKKTVIRTSKEGIKIINNVFPLKKAFESDSGYDIKANCSEPVTLEPGMIRTIDTGLHLDIPKGLEGQIRSRSGLTSKFGIAVLNAPGTIDSGYKGEIKVILINYGKESYIVNKEDKIAQIVFSRIYDIGDTGFELISDIKQDTEQNEKREIGGFGSTGK